LVSKVSSVAVAVAVAVAVNVLKKNTDDQLSLQINKQATTNSNL
jgi:hypothetical protein